MRISILEWNLASAAGRQQTMVSGFADCFAELGHDVKVYANFLRGHIPSKDKLLHYHLADHLTMENFDFSHRIQRRSPEGMPLEEWSQSDILLIPYPAYSWLGDYVTCPIFTWFIAKPERWWPEHVARVWTNSETQKERLGLEEARVIYAPHDYSVFREQAKPLEDRGVDVLVVAPITKTRENVHILSSELEDAQRLSDEGLKVLGLFLAKTSEEQRLVKELRFEHYVNIPRRYVAGFMGTSKVLFHPSPLESCSLVIFEALNSGCYPVVREAGACREQLGDVGLIYTDFEEARRHVVDVLKGGYEVGIPTSQGLKFDRRRNIDAIKEELACLK